MEFFKTNTNINFMRQRKWAALFSCILFAFSVFSLIVYHLHLGLDFTGGTQIEVTYPQAVDVNQIRSQLQQAGFSQAVVQQYGTDKDVLIRLGLQKIADKDQFKEQLKTVLPGGTLEQIQYIGPQVGKALATNGILAVLVSLLATMLYIAIRFEYRFAISAAVALIHDPILIL